MSAIVLAAQAFATGAHCAIGQVRKYTGEPYINHPRRVVDLVQGAMGNEEYVMAAAWLHDVVEDTQVKIETIEGMFGAYIAKLVADLTNVPKEAGNRKERFELNLAKLAKSDPAAASIKLADIVDNLSSIVQHDPQFALVYLREKDKAISVLTHGNPTLLRWAIREVEMGDRKLSP